MRVSHFIVAASLFASAGVSAQPADTTRHASVPSRNQVQSRHAVLDNIIGRVQMDVLIDRIVTSDEINDYRHAANIGHAVTERTQTRARS